MAQVGVLKLLAPRFCLTLVPVTAAYNWDDSAHLMTMYPPIKGSIEQLMVDAAQGDAFVITHEITDTEDGQTKKVPVSRELTE